MFAQRGDDSDVRDPAGSTAGENQPRGRLCAHEIGPAWVAEGVYQIGEVQARS